MPGNDQLRATLKEGSALFCATFLSKAHLYLQRFEVVRDACLDLPTHSFSRPLLESAELFVDIHIDGCCYLVEMFGRLLRFCFGMQMSGYKG